MTKLGLDGRTDHLIFPVDVVLFSTFYFEISRLHISLLPLRLQLLPFYTRVTEVEGNTMNNTDSAAIFNLT